MLLSTSAPLTPKAKMAFGGYRGNNGGNWGNGGGGRWGNGGGGNNNTVDPENVGNDRSKWPCCRTRVFRLQNHLMDIAEECDEKTGKFKNAILAFPNKNKALVQKYVKEACTV